MVSHFWERLDLQGSLDPFPEHHLLALSFSFLILSLILPKSRMWTLFCLNWITSLFFFVIFLVVGTFWFLVQQYSHICLVSRSRADFIKILSILSSKILMKTSRTGVSGSLLTELFFFCREPHSPQALERKYKQEVYVSDPNCYISYHQSVMHFSSLKMLLLKHKLCTPYCYQDRYAFPTCTCFSCYSGILGKKTRSFFFRFPPGNSIV